MAKYRQLQIAFWQDQFISELSPEDKYFYIYLMTNSMTTQCGIYTFNIKLAEYETGYNRDTIEKLLLRFADYGKILLSKTTKELMVVNWLKYNFINSKNTILCMNKELKEVKDMDFLKKFYDYCLKRNYPVASIFHGIDAFVSEAETDGHINTCGTTTDATADNGKVVDRDLAGTEAVEKDMAGTCEGACKDLGEEEIKEKIKQEEQSGTKEKGLAEVIKAFNSNIHLISPMERDRILDWLKDIEPGMLILAIEEAVNNNAKSMSYINSVINSWYYKGIRSEEGAAACLRDRRRSKHRNNSKNYNGNSSDSGFRNSSNMQKEAVRTNAGAYRILGGDEDE